MHTRTRLHKQFSKLFWKPSIKYFETTLSPIDAPRRDLFKIPKNSQNRKTSWKIPRYYKKNSQNRKTSRNFAFASWLLVAKSWNRKIMKNTMLYLQIWFYIISYIIGSTVPVAGAVGFWDVFSLRCVFGLWGMSENLKFNGVGLFAGVLWERLNAFYIGEFGINCQRRLKACSGQCVTNCYLIFPTIIPFPNTYCTRRYYLKYYQLGLAEH